MSRTARQFPLLLATTLLGAASVAACRREPNPARKVGTDALFQRGDVVVVERAAAEFFEGRVLSVAPSSLKVQTSEEGEPVAVVPGDAYRVATAARESTPGASGICNDRPSRWTACRLVAVNGATARVVLGTGKEATLPSSGVLRPSAVTALNVKKLFELGEARRRFDEAAAEAGQPQRPVGWMPEVREPVIARRGPNWFTAHVASMLEDGGVRVLFEGSERPEALPPNSVVPMPPYTRNFSRGDFALTRPKSATEPWARVRVEALGPEEAVVVFDDGEKRRFEVRQLVPVIPRP